MTARAPSPRAKGRATPRAPWKFTLAITLGNDAMRDIGDVARALRVVAARCGEAGSSEASGVIRDENGNAVGMWEIHSR